MSAGAGTLIGLRSHLAPHTALHLALLALCAAVLPLGCELRPQAMPYPEQPVEAPRRYPRVPAADAAAAQVPQGYRVEVVMRDLVYPTSVEFDDKDNMYVAEAGYVYGDHVAPSRVWRVTPDGEVSVIADQFNSPITDLLWHEGQLFVSHRGTISTVESGGTVLDIVTDLPSLGDHHNNQLTAGQDGKLYVGQGTATNAGVVGVDNFVYGWLPLYPHVHDQPARDIALISKTYATVNPFHLTDERVAPLATTSAFAPFGQKDGGGAEGVLKANGTVLRFNPDGSGIEVFAWGLRNPFGLMWSPDGRLFAAENGFDNRGSRPIANAPDTIWLIRQNAWYGWPDYASGIPVTSSRFKPADREQPEFIMTRHPQVEQAWLTRPPHTAVAKMDFSTSAEFGYAGQMFLAEFGSMMPMTGDEWLREVGPAVMRIDPATRQVQTFFTAQPGALARDEFRHVTTAGPRRPVDVRFSRDGRAMYVVDIGAMMALPTAIPTVRPFPGTGVIWRISRADSTIAGPPIDLSPLAGRGREAVAPVRPARADMRRAEGDADANIFE